MNPMTGEIHRISEEESREMKKEFIEKLNKTTDRSDRMMSLEQKLVSLSEEEVEKLEPLNKRDRKGWMRNQPCPCGSGKKFKKCCWSKFS